jgi:tetratricopeptide (TPR) repeat protein
MNPKYAEAYYNRGTSYLRLGKYSESIRDYDRAIEINNKYADAYNNRAYAYWRLGDEKQSIDDLKTAAQLGYKNAQKTLSSKGMGW